MGVKGNIFLFLTISLSLMGCNQTDKAQQPANSILPNNAFFQYTGRINGKGGTAPEFHWAGSAVKFRFEGPMLTILLSDPGSANYFNVIIDGDEENLEVIACDSSQTFYPITTPLTDTTHEVLLVRRTDPTNPATKFLGIILANDKYILSPTPLPPYKIEFYGNSITSGHGVRDESRQHNDHHSTWDNYFAFPGIASRALHAEYHCISRSGIGLTKSWYPLTMPQLYNRISPDDSIRRWDFSQWTPDLVVVNLLQNDSWILENHQPKKIIKAYMNFIQSIRQHYPEKPIICLLGNMDITQKGSPWPGYVEEATFNMNDPKVFTLFFPHKNTDGHPVLSEQTDMANRLVTFIQLKKLLPQ